MRRTIPHEELMQLPILRYSGAIRLPATNADLQQALQDILQERVVGFDTETRPTFRKGQTHAPSLVQIATGRAVYLFQLARLDCSRALAEVFANAQVIKAGLAPADDLAGLRKLFAFEATHVVDLSSIAKRHKLEQTGLRNLAGIFLGGRITKGARTSNWARPRLSRSQIVYAATDAWVCRQLYLRFEALGWLPPPPKR